MHHRLAIKHLSGSRANTLDRLSLPPEREIVFGRDRECHVRYEEADDLVSRKHLKIVATEEPRVRYMVVDLGSRNGTFVNRQRVFGAVVLLPGAHVQLGPGGPAFEFRLETEEARRVWPFAAVFRKRLRARGDGRAWKSRLGKSAFVLCLLAGTAVCGYGAWTRMAPLWKQWRRPPTVQTLKPRFRVEAAMASVASVEAEWNVFDKQTGVRLARAYIANQRIARAEPVPLVEGAPDRLPVFVVGEDRRIEPLLVPAGTKHAGQAVGGRWTSKGVIVSKTGAVLTAAPDQRPWNIVNQWTAEESAGALLVLDSQKITQVVPLAVTQFPRWAPTQSGFFAAQLPEDLRSDLSGRRVGKDDLRVEVTASVAEPGRILKTTMAGESAGIWLAAVQPGSELTRIQLPPLDDGAARPKKSQAVWVVGNEIEAAEIQDAPADGLITLRASGCSEGGVVFDQDGRVLALCIPDAHSRARAGLAVPVGRGRALLSGVTDDLSR